MLKKTKADKNIKREKKGWQGAGEKVTVEFCNTCGWCDREADGWVAPNVTVMTSAITRHGPTDSIDDITSLYPVRPNTGWCFRQHWWGVSEYHFHWIKFVYHKVLYVWLYQHAYLLLMEWDLHTLNVDSKIQLQH